MTRLVAYTDGACSGNPGPGGWGVLMRAERDGAVVKERELQGGEAETTNNRMELMAAISALEVLERASDITIVTDSAYVKNGVSQWIHGWKRNGWRTAGQEAGQECRALATAGRGADAPQRDMGMGQGPCGPPGK